MNTFFKSAFLILALCATLILFGIYHRMRNDHFKLIMNGNNSSITAVDTETGKVYYWSGARGWLDMNDMVPVKNLFDQ
jgi:hypothetical protein